MLELLFIINVKLKTLLVYLFDIIIALLLK